MSVPLKLIEEINISEQDRKEGLRVVTYIEKVWYDKQLSDKEGFIERNPKIQTKKCFKFIDVHLKDGNIETFLLNLNQYKAYSIYKYIMMGVL